MISRLARTFVYPLQERLFKRPTFSYLASLERTQWLSPAELEHLQREKLAGLLSIALAHSPWHAERIRAAGIELGEGRLPSLDDLRRLPTMSKADAREHGSRMAWHGVPGGASRYNTGGSTGEPLIFYFGRWRQASDAAGRMRAHRWFGVEVGEPELYLWGAPAAQTRTDRIKALRDRLVNHLLLNAFEMSPANMDAYIRCIKRFRPRCMYGYASSIALLAAHARETGQDPRVSRMRAVFTTGEPLYDHQRQLIREVFEVPVANEWGSRDIGFTAHEDTSGRMRLMSESHVLEVLDADGNPVPAGELGEAVITGLCSDVQPFIRYRTGDMVRLATEPASDGRGLPVVAEVAGRTTDFVVRADGTVMHALAVIYVLRAVPGVVQFKLIQHSVRDVEILVVRGAGWDPASERIISRGIRERLGEDVRVDLHPVDAVPCEASGKYRYVVSNVPLSGGLSNAVG
jgi:phenylacetate-CoA ligase